MGQPSTLWIKEIGDSLCYFTSVDALADSGFYLTGPHQAQWLVRANSQGDTVWTRQISEIGNFSADHSRVFTTSDGGCVLTTGGDPWLMKYDLDGNKLWELAFSTLGLDTLPAFDSYIFGGCVVLDDGALVFSGFYRYGGNDFPFFVKTTAAGTITWMKSLAAGMAWKMVRTSSGNLAVAGTYKQESTNTEGPGLLQLSVDGDSLKLNIFRNNINDENGNRYELQSIDNTIDDGFILAGKRSDSLGTDNYYVVRAGASGDLVWENTFGGNYAGGANYVTQVDTSFMVGGMASDTTAMRGVPWTILLSSSGALFWESDFDLVSESVAFDLTKVSTGEFLVAGATILQYEPSFSLTGFLLCLSFNGAVAAFQPVFPRQIKIYQNYPNPFNPITTIQYELPVRSDVQITIYNLLGKEITTLVSKTQEPGYKSIQWDATNVTSGVYFYQIRAGKYVETRKMVLLK